VTKVSERVKAISGSTTPEMMRAAIRAKLRTGTSKQTICWLVCAYAPPGATNDRTEGSVPRLPVELIPDEKRGAFLDALSKLPDRVVTTIDRLVGTLD
jgi:hypothetical protein